jgi:D-alanyl-lipoteichoic acid acyltransferase DltB (MBOAT superfamily)
MDFSNPLALFFFFGFTALYWLLPRRWQLYWVALFPTAYLLIFAQYAALGSIILMTAGCYLMSGSPDRQKNNGVLTRNIAGISLLCGIFLAYKFVQNMAAGEGETLVLLGASFYILKMIHYLAESYNRNLKPHSFLEFSAYIVFPPTLLVGPINRFPEFLRDERRKRWDPKLFYSGLERVLFGYFKVVVLANYLLDTKLQVYIDTIGGNDTAYGAWLGCLEYGLDLYFRFGGYCDIAIGLAALLGFRILENFHYPFIRSNISAFWKSWHISLSSWCRDYVFTPVAFLLKRPALGILASMLILGIWHELSWRYIAWGLYHGLGIVAFQMWSRVKLQMPGWLHLPGALSTALGVIITFNFVILSFAITSTDDLSQAMAIYRTIFGGV